MSAAIKWAKSGLKPEWILRRATSFTGLGKKIASGKLKMPMAIRLEDAGLMLPGSVQSHEIPGASHPTSISQACQAKLGMTKSMRSCTIALDDYEGERLRFRSLHDPY